MLGGLILKIANVRIGIDIRNDIVKITYDVFLAFIEIFYSSHSWGPSSL